MKKNEEDNRIKPSSEEIDRSVSVLENLVKDTEPLVNLPEEQRIALLKWLENYPAPIELK